MGNISGPSGPSDRAAGLGGFTPVPTLALLGGFRP